MAKWILRILAVCAGIICLLTVLVVSAYFYLSTRTNGELVSGNNKRTFLFYVPESYDPSSPTPLIISLHGAFLYPRFQKKITQWNDLADEEGFIVVYPKASGFPPLWGMEPGEKLTTELQFFSDLIDWFADEYTIDENRVYVNGFSNGAAMTSMLACTMADRIAAFGLVATPVAPQDWCQSPDPAPIIAVHGTSDPYSLYYGGENFLTDDPLPALEDWIKMWADINQCNPVPEWSETAADVQITSYTACMDGASVRAITIENAGHVWPGGMEFPGNFAGPNSDSINTTEVMWEFFQQHPLTQ